MASNAGIKFVFIVIAIIAVGVLYFIIRNTEPVDENTITSDVVVEREVIGGSVEGRPYSPAIKTTKARLDSSGERTVLSETIYVSGQVAIDPDTGNEIHTSITDETNQVIENMKKWLNAGGFGLKDVVKCTVFLSDMSDYGEMNAAYLKYFPENQPARECVAVKGIALGFNVEISCIAEK